MTGKKLWSASTTENNINLFIEYLGKKDKFKSYQDLHKWSIERKDVFWDKFWQFTNIIGEKKDKIFSESKHFIETKFFN